MTCRRARGDAARRFGGRRGTGERRVRADAAREPRAPARADRSRRARLPAGDRALSGYAPASVGLAHVEASRGDLETAIRRYRATVARAAVPEYPHRARRGGARGRAARLPPAAHISRSPRQETAARSNGENTNTEAALFEASHGNPQRAVVLGRRAWARSPSVRAADALGWALTRAGRPAAGLSTRGVR